MYDKILAVFALSLFLGFLGIVGVWVEGWDIKIVLAITGAMAAYDFWLNTFGSKSDGNGKS